jgi:hypothetical protein
MSVCELAAHNDNVRDYVSHWEGRTLAAEAESARLKAENELFRDSQMFCEGCDEPTMKEHRELKDEVAQQSIENTKLQEQLDDANTNCRALRAEAARLREELAQRFTIDEIADYIAGWTIGGFDEVQKLGQQVAGNALQQLRHEEDGIAAARSRKQALAAVRSCGYCDGTGGQDSGGVTPWGSEIIVKCGHCDGTGKEALAAVGGELKAEVARLRSIIERLEEAHSDERDELWCRPIHAEALAAVCKKL